MRTSDRLTLALLKQKITKALQEMRSACEALNFESARAAEKEMNAALDDLAKRLAV